MHEPLLPMSELKSERSLRVGAGGGVSDASRPIFFGPACFVSILSKRVCFTLKSLLHQFFFVIFVQKCWIFILRTLYPIICSLVSYRQVRIDEPGSFRSFDYGLNLEKWQACHAKTQKKSIFHVFEKNEVKTKPKNKSLLILFIKIL